MEKQTSQSTRLPPGGFGGGTLTSRPIVWICACAQSRTRERETDDAPTSDLMIPWIYRPATRCSQRYKPKKRSDPLSPVWRVGRRVCLWNT